MDGGTVQNIDTPSDSQNPKIVPKSIWDQTAKLVPQSHMSLDCGSGTNRDCETEKMATKPNAMTNIELVLILTTLACLSCL